MAEPDRVLFAGSIPQAYDALMVPMLFDAFAGHTAALVAAGGPRAVLETAAGSGAVTRALAPLLGEGARYVVTDLSPAMVAHAQARQGPDARIEWRQADALALPFDDAAFDAVCCQFGAMFFPDRVAGYRETRRVLRPGGRFVFTVWDRIEDNAFADAATRALATVFPDDPPRFLARLPHGYHDLAQIREDLRQAGFTQVDAQTREAQSRAPSARDVAVALCHGSPLRGEIEARDAGRLPQAVERVAEAIAQRHGSGPVAGKMQAHVIVAAG